jgi:hypothetical protein
MESGSRRAVMPITVLMEPTQYRFTTATLGDGWARLSARREIGCPLVDLNHLFPIAVATR